MRHVALTLLLLAVVVACGSHSRAPDAGAPEGGKEFRGVAIAPMAFLDRGPMPARGPGWPLRTEPLATDAGAPRLRASRPTNPRVASCIAENLPTWEDLVACIQAPPAPAVDAGHRLGDFVPPPTTNPAWQIPEWHIKSTGNDHNTCVTSGSPCQHWSRILDRLGTSSPTLTSSVAIFIDDSQTADTDRIVWTPYLDENSETFIQCQWSQVDTGTITVTQANSHTAADGRLQLSLSGASAGSVLATDPTGLFVVNTTRASSLAPVLDLVSGTTVWMGQPFDSNIPTPPAIPNLNPGPNEINTWATGDAYTMYRLANAFISEYRPRTVESRAIAGVTRYVFGSASHCRVPDQMVSGQIGNASLYTGKGVGWVESWIDAATLNPDRDAAGDTQFANTVLAGDGVIDFSFVTGGATGSISPPVTSNLLVSNVNLDGDVVVRAPVVVEDGFNFFGRMAFVNDVQVTDQARVYASSIYQSSTPVLYGTYLLNVGGFNAGAPAGFGYLNSATATFQGVPTIALDDRLFGVAYDTAHSPSPQVPHIAITPANIDAAISSGGAGGTMFGYGGSVIDNSSPSAPPATSAYYVAGANVTLTGCNTAGSTCTIAASAGASCPIDLSSCVTNTLAVSHGGTGDATCTGVPVGSGTSAFTCHSPLDVPNGGTGATSLTNFGVLIGDATSAINATAAGTNDQLLSGVTSGAPAFISYPSNQCDVNSTGLFTSSGAQVTLCSFTLTTANATQKNLINAEFGAGVGSATAFSYTVGVAIGGCGSPTFIEPTLTPMFNGGGITMWANGGVTFTDAPGAATTTTYCAVISASAAGPGTAVIGSMTGHTIPQ